MDLTKLKEMEYDELRGLIEVANAEMAARRNKMQEEAWGAVKKAINEYTCDFGDIILDHYEYRIPDTCNFSTVGTILTYEKEEDY